MATITNGELGNLTEEEMVRIKTCGCGKPASVAAASVVHENGKVYILSGLCDQCIAKKESKDEY